MSPAKSKILQIMAAASASFGLFLSCVAAYYLFGYFSNSSSDVRHEYLEGVALSLLISLPFWVLVSCFTFPIRSTLDRKIYWALNIPAVLLLASYGLANIYVVFQALS